MYYERGSRDVQKSSLTGSVDEMARHVMQKARELPERKQVTDIGEASVDGKVASEADLMFSIAEKQ